MEQNNQMNTDETLNMVKDSMRRLRLLEEKYNNLRKTIVVNEQNMLSQNKKINHDVKSFENDILELKKHIRSMSEEIKLIIKEVQNTVKKNEVKVLEKYISFWDPLSYVTKSEVNSLIKKHIEYEFKKKDAEEK
ncbi:MAG: hypothetical protein ACLFPJ_02090 [Candidatus Woesearchaeota archaeon]